MSKKVHPYIPNMVPEVKQKMLDEIGVHSINELYSCIPEKLRFKGTMNIPKALNELELRRHIEGLLNKNLSTNEYLNFLGAGCWQHFIPAVCDEVNQRAEFLTAYAGEPYEDHGRFQALFEYQSLMAELMDMEVVNVPTFDWAQAAATSIRMASRITKRSKVLFANTVSPERKKIIINYGTPQLTFEDVNFNLNTGLMDLTDLEEKLSNDVAAIYFENPSYLGFIESQGQEISNLAKKYGAIMVVGVDPISLGILAPPSQYGADIVCGDLQPLGMHMNFSGGQAGFIATHNDPTFINEYPSRLFGIIPTVKEGEYGFGDIAYDRTSFADRENGKESVGTQTALWGITAGVYLSLMGPNGMYDLGQAIMQNSQYAVMQLNKIKNIRGSRITSPFFKEFIIDFNDTGLTVEEINKQLLEHKIFGGKDLSKEFPQYGQSALCCVTEVHTKEDIDKLVSVLSKVVSK
ncbi:aminomethyl-transferring glycine dehydrogenase subunit GcvPA [Lysinibacillus xylanilyticus]|uniref:Aminomethyl-transferring glycine dehydrogenase subunit GcvPA n=1 Tax=Lysinibacillus xylanilyticus TaxID=582475 RepID=A0ABT4EPX6_9BACI|nr:aminomethyl-transferring glycine dehydrogenase subunit GcvPA [Lysinibacillus xylanilyticus]MCY9547737.1 aminomethyl-transferring glycine dehydrogenase subunit GcvPA [Lysinibacillus xylanilyticus]